MQCKARTCFIAASEPAGILPPWILDSIDCDLPTSPLVMWKVSSVPDILIEDLLVCLL